MADDYKIKITTEADVKGAKAATEAVKQTTEATEELRTAQKSAQGTVNESLTQQAKYDRQINAVTQSKHRLKDALKGLAFEFPVAGRLFSLFLNPMASGIAAAVGLFAILKKEITEFEAAIEDTASTTKFQDWIEVQKKAVDELRTQMRQFREELDEFQGDPNDPQRLANQQAASLRNQARREGDVDQAAVAAGRMTPEQAKARAVAREGKLARDLENVRESEVFNISVERNLAKDAAEEQAKIVAGTRSPEAIQQSLADLKARRDAEAADRDRLKAADAGLILGDADPRRLGFRKSIFTKDRVISDLDAQIAAAEAAAPGEISQSQAARRELQRRQQRANSLDQRGEQDVFNQPFQRQEFQRDEDARKIIEQIQKQAALDAANAAKAISGAYKEAFTEQARQTKAIKRSIPY